jgi:hypothetical protein
MARSEFLLTRILNSEYAVKVGPAGDHRAVLRNLFRSLRPPHRWAHSPTMGGYPLHRQRERSRFRKAQTSLIGVAMSAESFADSRVEDNGPERLPGSGTGAETNSDEGARDWMGWTRSCWATPGGCGPGTGAVGREGPAAGRCWWRPASGRSRPVAIAPGAGPGRQPGRHGPPAPQGIGSAAGAVAELGRADIAAPVGRVPASRERRAG